MHQVRDQAMMKPGEGKSQISSEDFENSHRQLRNIVLIFGNLYIFDSVSCDFVKSLIEYFCKNLNDQVLELTLLLIQNTGSKIRSDNPRILKDLITLIKEASDQYTKVNNFQTKKQEFILQTLNDIKLNKRIKADPIEKLNFLINWVKKNVIHRFKLSQKLFPMDFEGAFNSDFSSNRWWIPTDSNNFKNKGVKTEDITVISKLI